MWNTDLAKKRSMTLKFTGKSLFGERAAIFATNFYWEIERVTRCT